MRPEAARRARMLFRKPLYKSIIGPRLRARGFKAQKTEAAIGVAVLNRMLTAGRPNSVRSQNIPA